MVSPLPVQLFISTVSNLGTKRHQKIVEDAKQMKASNYVCAYIGLERVETHWDHRHGLWTK